MENLSRRSFLTSASAAVAGTVFLPNLISCKPSNRLNIAVIGVGGRGSASWTQVPKESIVAMCDVDDRQTAQGFKACPNAKRYKDFRVMLDEMHRDIDAVIIATPDHTHFAAAMACMELGMHVFVEKPLCHNIWQSRTLKKAAKHYGVVSQMGNQGHTTNGIRLVKEWYDMGLLGQVKEVHAWQPPLNNNKSGAFYPSTSFPPEAQQVPKELDWNLWQGQASERPFNKVYAPGDWRGFYYYGNGKLGDWCCHTLDAPFWALDLGMPYHAEGKQINPIADHTFVSEQSLVTWKFAARGEKAPVTMKWYEGFGKPEVRPEWGISELPVEGMIMIGEKKTLITGMRPNDARLLVPKEEWEEFKKNPPAKTIPRILEEKPVQEWIAAIKSHTLPGSNFDYSASLVEMAQVGILAQRFGGEINYDAKTMKAVGRPELDIYIKEPARKGWSYGENLW
jgi:hypothetical protein